MRKLFGQCSAQQAEAAMDSESQQQKRHAFGTLLGRLRIERKKAKITDCHQKMGATVSLKLVLTKEEAARLLALYVGEREEMLSETVREHERPQARGAWTPMLECIPEDS